MKVLEKVCFLLFLTNVDSRQHHRACFFNPLCTCSNGGPDLGSVHCYNIPFMTMPANINNSAIYIMSLQNNKLRFLEDNSLNGTELWKLQINKNLLTDLPSNALAGLEQTLSILDLSQNQLIRIPKEAMQNLQKLNNLILAVNHITFLYNDDFRGISKHLKLLDLSHNGIMHIQTDVFRSMVALEVLNLGFNMILSIDDIMFQNGLTNLKHIFLMGNQLQQIPLNALASLKNIKTVNLNDNMISTISEGRETRTRIYLEELHLEKNLITKLTPQSFRLFGQINRLFLAANPLIVVNDTFLTLNVSEVYMQHCKISHISDNAFYSAIHSLQVLDLSSNELKELPTLSLTKLVRLSLAGNEIKEISPKSIHSFSGTLKYLDIRGSKMNALTKEILSNVLNLREYQFNKKIDKEYLSKLGPLMEKLSITTSSIETLENGAFHSVSSLKELDLSYNSISKIESDVFKDVRHALLNLILHKTLKGSEFPQNVLNILTKLEYLDVSGNNLVYMPYESFNTFQNLKQLNLNFNELNELYPNFITDINNPNIDTFKIAFNKLTTVNSYTFRNLKKLVNLQLNDNLIRNIKKSAFLDLNSLINIQLEGNLIEKIENEAFQNLPNIEYINLAYNKLPSLNLEAFNQVGRLSTLKIAVDFNNIQNLTANYTLSQTSSNIKSLNFSNNNISFIDSKYFDPIRMSIVILDLNENKVQNLTLSAFINMAHLQILILSNNMIDTIDENEFKGITALQILNLSQNYLTTLTGKSFQHLTKLRIFSVANNFLQDLPENIFRTTPVEQLDLSFNNFSEFPHKSIMFLKNTLQYLDLSGNYIHSLNLENFQDLEKLKYLSLSHNKLSTLNAEGHIYLPKLIEFDLSHNPIQNLPHLIHKILPSSLEVLNLANTTLTEIPLFNITDILMLNLSSNLIDTIKQERLELQKKLRSLDFSNNFLSTTHNNVWSNFQHLRKLYLQNNPIHILSNTSFEDMTRLQQLFIHNLTLEDIPKNLFHPLTALKKLEMNTYPEKMFNLSEMLSKNQGIEEIHLHVQENELEEFFDENLPKSVKKIILEGENLRSIHESRFSNFPSRNFYLDIRNTNLTRISHHFFQNMKQVKNLTASFINNKLQTIERMYNEKEIPSKYLKNVKLFENKLDCNCHLSWVWEWMKEYEYEFNCDIRACEENYLEGLRDAKCINLNNKSIIDAFKTDLDCFSNSGYFRKSEFVTWLSALIILLFLNSVQKQQ